MIIESESSHINRIQLILADKRTSLAVLRTGIALITLPLSIVALLVATSKYYDIFSNLHFLIPLFIINSMLVIFGVVLIVRSWRRILQMDEAICKIAHEDEAIGKTIEYRKKCADK